jgi:uncharacterized protein YuzE
MTREDGIIRYDPSCDAAYVRVRSGPVARTEKLTDGVLIDYDAAGAILGIELLDVQEKLRHIQAVPVTFSGRALFAEQVTM